MSVVPLAEISFCPVIFIAAVVSDFALRIRSTVKDCVKLEHQSMDKALLVLTFIDYVFGELYFTANSVGLSGENISTTFVYAPLFDPSFDPTTFRYYKTVISVFFEEFNRQIFAIFPPSLVTSWNI